MNAAAKVQYRRPYPYRPHRGGQIIRKLLAAGATLIVISLVGGVMMLMAVFATEAAVRARVPVSLGYRHTVVVGGENVAAQGTWAWQGAQPAFPIHVVHIFCYHEQMRCVVATASVGAGNALSADSDEYQITEWTKNQITFSEETFCKTSTYNIDVETQTVSGLTRRRYGPDRDDVCKNEPEVRYSLVDGIDVWEKMVLEATPWYGKIAAKAPDFIWRLTSID